MSWLLRWTLVVTSFRKVPGFVMMFTPIQRRMAEVGPSTNTQGLRERLGNVRERIDTAARHCNRLPDEITLVAISKTHPAEAVAELINLGATDLGENRVQEAEQKIHQLGQSKARWHLVGHLQANKARRAVRLFDVIH